MKKILLLFVLFLGFSFGAFAASEWQIIVDHDNGTVTVLDDGKDCSSVEEWSGDQGQITFDDCP